MSWELTKEAKKKEKLEKALKKLRQSSMSPVERMLENIKNDPNSMRYE